MKHHYLTLLFIGAILGALQAQAPKAGIRKLKYKPDQLYVFKQRDKSFTPGYVLTRSETDYRVATLKGDTIVIPFMAICKIVAVSMDDIKDGAYWPVNPFNYKYWFLPSGFTPGDGQARMSLYYINAASVAVGIGSNMQIEAGTEFSLMLDAIYDNEAPPSVLHLKTAFPIANQLQVGGGIGVAFLPDYFSTVDNLQSRRLSAGYGLVTVGYPDTHLTFSYMLAEGERAKLRHFASLSIAHRISRSRMLISENWTSLRKNDNFGFLSLGIRKFGPRASFDFSAAGLLWNNPYRQFGISLIPFPFFGASFRLSK